MGRQMDLWGRCKSLLCFAQMSWVRFSWVKFSYEVDCGSEIVLFAAAAI